MRSSHVAALAAAACLVHAAAANAQFQLAAGHLPATGGHSQQLDFADIDHDGDIDALIANGAEELNQQNRVLINLGGAQGGSLGFFADETGARLPVQQNGGFDVEFADIDADGDFDVHTSNTAQLINQGNRWWIDTSGVGHYQDQTATRWVGLGQPGSSIHPALVLAGGSFIDWCADSDFGDVDGDGDLDLFHSSCGPVFGGQVPTRLFRNDGAGFFTEFNPTGFQLAGTSIADGDPGIWCQGVQKANTMNSTGAECDIASSALDVDLFDADGDFDLDLLHGARQEAPRYFRNRLVENGGFLRYWDVTGSALPAEYWSGGDNYEQDQADMDNDGDWDLFGVNWPGSSEAVFNNTSTLAAITYANMQTLASSGNDDNEGDFLDYDGDGDLDLVVAAFIGSNRLYRNNYAGGAPGTFSYTQVSPTGFTSGRALETEVGDVDGDGDYDVMTAEDSAGDERLYLNVLNPGDNRAALIAKTEALASHTAAAGARTARATIQDSGSYYTTWYNATKVRVTVDGCALPDLAARTSQGNLFHALVPGNLVGAVDYAWRSTDEHGNTGVSALKSYTGTYGGAHAVAFGVGSPGTSGTPSIQALSVAFPGTTSHVAVTGLPAGTTALLYLTDAQLGAPLSLPGLCNINIGGAILAQRIGAADGAGCLVGSFAVPAGAPPGLKAYAEGFGLNGVAGNLLSSTQGLELTIQ
ncbi:MAG: VCBS repeat-containing protein [Planctomycetota bacterium]|nr:MAG: VCBS repeat-containing protein [Planctomycetota bacterium]